MNRGDQAGIGVGVRVGLFIPCFVDQLFPQVGIATVTVLRRVGVEVDFPEGQTCCGQPAFNTGYLDEARVLAERFAREFGGYEAIVAPSGSCVAMVRNFYAALGVRPLPVFELSEFLVRRLGVTNVGARFAARVTYHDGCHALRELRLKEEPRALLREVRGLELVEMDAAETCCGFGGTFAVKFPHISEAMDEVKCASAARTGAEYVVSTDSSCLMQIASHLRRYHPGVRAISLAEVLAST